MEAALAREFDIAGVTAGCCLLCRRVSVIARLVRILRLEGVGWATERTAGSNPNCVASQRSETAFIKFFAAWASESGRRPSERAPGIRLPETNPTGPVAIAHRPTRQTVVTLSSGRASVDDTQ